MSVANDLDLYKEIDIGLKIFRVGQAHDLTSPPTEDAGEDDEEEQGHPTPHSFNCQFCNQPHPRLSDLEAHIRKWHVVSRVFECPICDDFDPAGADENDLLDHVSLSHGSLLAPSHPCPHCDVLSFGEKDLFAHMNRRHSATNEDGGGGGYDPGRNSALGIQSDLVVVEVEKDPLDVAALLEDKKKTSPKITSPNSVSRTKKSKLPTCRMCQMSFVKASELLQHFKKSHKGLKVYECRQCSYESNLEYYIRKHESDCHPAERRRMGPASKTKRSLPAKKLESPFKFEDKEGGRREKMPRKSSSGSSSSDLTCCCCRDYVVRDPEALRLHYSRAHMDRRGQYHCSICSYSTRQKSNFVRHCSSSVHVKKMKDEGDEEEDDDTSYPCLICDYSGATRGRTLEHMKASHAANLAEVIGQ